MAIRKHDDILEFWQEVHGILDPKWHKKFLSHKAIGEILTHPTENIKVAIRRNQKLSEILEDLRHQQSKKEEFLDKYDKYRKSRQVDTGTKIDQREKKSRRWGRAF